MSAPNATAPLAERRAVLPWVPAGLRRVGFALAGAGGGLGYAALVRGFRPHALDVHVFALHARYFESKRFAFIEKNVTVELASVMLLVGLFFMAFARDAVETEAAERTRLWALAWAACLGAAFLLLATLTLYGVGFAYAVAAHAVVTLALASGLATVARARAALLARRGGVAP